MSNITNIIDRIYTDYLYRPDDQPAVVPIVSSVDSDDTTVTWTGSYLGAEEEDAIVPGALLEAGSELMRVVSVNTSAKTVTVTRGVLSTVAAAHTAGALLTISPRFPRRSVFNVVADTIDNLYPSLFAVHVEDVYDMSGIWMVDTDLTVDRVLECRVFDGFTYQPGGAELLTGFPDASSDTVIQFPPTQAGQSGYVKLAVRFTRPTAESDTFRTVGIDEAWMNVIVTGAATNLVGQIESGSNTQRYITETLEREGYPVGSGQKVRDALLRWHLYLLEQARRQLLARHGVAMMSSGFSYQGW